jgi:hypothetical protein
MRSWSIVVTVSRHGCDHLRRHAVVAACCSIAIITSIVVEHPASPDPYRGHQTIRCFHITTFIFNTFFIKLRAAQLPPTLKDRY